MKKPRTTSLNDDLLTLILLRLPLKSVAKFKSVSRHWLHLITTTPQFSLPKPLKALFSNGFHITVLPLDGTTPPAKTTFLPAKATYKHSSNGLYLSYKKYYKKNNNSVHEFYVSNPMTKLYAPLPQQYPRTPFGFGFHLIKAAYLAFDPYVSSYYKVVVFFRQSPALGAMIYSSETRHWRLSSAPFQFQNLQRYDDGVFWNGAIYWTSVDKYDYSLKDKPKVYRFQVFGEEKMEQVTLPSSDHVLYLGLSGEQHLHLIMSVYDDDLEVGVLNIYEMDKGSGRWCHVHSLHNLAGDVRARLGIVKVVPTSSAFESWRGAVPCCRVVFFDEETCLYLVAREMVVRYDFKARTVAEIHKLKHYHPFIPFSQQMEVIYKVGLIPLEEA